jgi:GLPGLI family protein
MNKVSLIIFLLVIPKLFGQSTNLKAVYTKKITHSIISNYKTDNEKRKLLIDIENQTKNVLEDIKFELIVKGNKSIFRVMKNVQMENKNFYMSALGLGINLKGDFYSNIEENEVLNQKDSYGETFIIKDVFDKHQWVLYNETKIIGNFLCFKAETYEEVINPYNNEVNKKIITCWYYPKIPIKFGVGNYTNLPGLVVRLETDNAMLTLDEVVLNPKEVLKISKPKKGKLINVIDFNDLGKKMAKDLIDLKMR